jgi:hypothetical protein
MSSFLSFLPGDRTALSRFKICLLQGLVEPTRQKNKLKEDYAGSEELSSIHKTPTGSVLQSRLTHFKVYSSTARPIGPSVQSHESTRICRRVLISRPVRLHFPQTRAHYGIACSMNRTQRSNAQAQRAFFRVPIQQKYPSKTNSWSREGGQDANTMVCLQKATTSLYTSSFCSRGELSA